MDAQMRRWFRRHRFAILIDIDVDVRERVFVMKWIVMTVVVGRDVAVVAVVIVLIGRKEIVHGVVSF